LTIADVAVLSEVSAEVVGERVTSGSSVSVGVDVIVGSIVAVAVGCACAVWDA